MALAKPAEKPAAFLDVICDDDKALRARLVALLAAHDQPATELAGADASTVKADATMELPDEAVGQTLGRYKLLEQIGEGGCGMVYVAEQTEPVRRWVALNVITARSPQPLGPSHPYVAHAGRHVRAQEFAFLPPRREAT